MPDSNATKLLIHVEIANLQHQWLGASWRHLWVSHSELKAFLGLLDRPGQRVDGFGTGLSCPGSASSHVGRGFLRHAMSC